MILSLFKKNKKNTDYNEMDVIIENNDSNDMIDASAKEEVIKKAIDLLKDAIKIFM